MHGGRINERANIVCDVVHVTVCTEMVALASVSTVEAQSVNLQWSSHVSFWYMVSRWKSGWDKV